MMQLPDLSIMSETLAVCRMAAGEAIPGWATAGTFFSITRTIDEFSIVCEAARVPEAIQQETGWRAFKVMGPLDFALVGVLAGISGVLAHASVSLFVISTYDTDYILVREAVLTEAVQALGRAGYRIIDNQQGL